jgi:hypothetical protein
VDAEGGHASAVEDAFDAEIELLIFGQMSGGEVFCGFELESLIDTTLLVGLFGRIRQVSSFWLLVSG